eukprot:scaffold12116_cov52-Phaeocystis_antarctica.AAC.3
MASSATRRAARRLWTPSPSGSTRRSSWTSCRPGRSRIRSSSCSAASTARRPVHGIPNPNPDPNPSPDPNPNPNPDPNPNPNPTPHPHRRSSWASTGSTTSKASRTS